MRTQANALRFAAKLGESCEAYIVEGGLDAWRKAGLPVVSDRRQPLELQRQVQIGAGTLAFVGAGLITAGVTGFCGMARILVRAPWNRSVYGARTRAA